MLVSLLEQLYQMGRKIDKLEKPVGVDYIWGDKRNETEGFGTLGIALLVPLLSWFT
jgi:HAE1 family hydrophobic/amphiphilic exporter-1